MEIYQMAQPSLPWNIFPMAASPDKKLEAEKRARALYLRLMALRDEREPELSNNLWTDRAGVSTSFFTNMQGVNKRASEPSIGNVRLVLEAMGTSLPEFFVGEAQGRLIPAPTQQALEQALGDALDDGLPQRRDARIAYLASTVRNLLGLPENRPANRDAVDVQAAASHEATAPAPLATKRASRR